MVLKLTVWVGAMLIKIKSKAIHKKEAKETEIELYIKIFCILTSFVFFERKKGNILNIANIKIFG